jgi:hypothetical protein
MIRARRRGRGRVLTTLDADECAAAPPAVRRTPAWGDSRLRRKPLSVGAKRAMGVRPGAQAWDPIKVSSIATPERRTCTRHSARNPAHRAGSPRAGQRQGNTARAPYASHAINGAGARDQHAHAHRRHQRRSRPSVRRFLARSTGPAEGGTATLWLPSTRRPTVQPVPARKLRRRSRGRCGCRT